MKAQDDLYRLKCSSCHRLYPAESYSYEKLSNYTDTYGKGLNVDERNILLEYFKINSMREK